jgi:hypothetical protein
VRVASLSLLLALLAPLGACSRGGTPGPVTVGEARPPPPFDWERPAAALGLGPDEVAARLGSFAWEGTVAWSTAKGERKVEVAERHAVRQLATGEFAADGTMDPGRGPGSESGKRVIWARGMSYARSLHPASGEWRQRPTDHGRGARRFRDESFLLAGEVAGLLGPALVASPAGTASALGRPARRFALSLDLARFTPGTSRLSDAPPPGGPDTATKARLALLDGREPIEASGELLLDAATGAPLQARISAVLGVKGDPEARIRIDVDGRFTALGGEVGPVEPPRNALPDERKPRGVARALEQAGLGRKKGGEASPADDADEDVAEE